MKMWYKVHLLFHLSHCHRWNDETWVQSWKEERRNKYKRQAQSMQIISCWHFLLPSLECACEKQESETPSETCARLSIGISERDKLKCSQQRFTGLCIYMSGPLKLAEEMLVSRTVSERRRGRWKITCSKKTCDSHRNKLSIRLHLIRRVSSHPVIVTSNDLLYPHALAMLPLLRCWQSKWHVMLVMERNPSRWDCFVKTRRRGTLFGTKIFTLFTTRVRWNEIIWDTQVTHTHKYTHSQIYSQIHNALTNTHIHSQRHTNIYVYA